MSLAIGCYVHVIESWLRGRYVLPAPTLSGTAGAVIRIRFGIPSLDALMDVGISGPIFGFVVAMPATLVGLLLSKTAPGPTQSVLIRLHAPLAMQLLYAPMRWIMPSFPPIEDLIWHPMLIAAWVGLFITSLNLIPAGQLDGGHSLCGLAAMAPLVHDRRACLAADRGDYVVGRMDILGADSAHTGDAAFVCAFGPRAMWVASDFWRGGVADARADFSACPLCGCGIAGVPAVGTDLQSQFASQSLAD